ncbi:twin-arginine translocation signal domain-containing protein [Oricola sp.]|uniref:twin-arginine translocation signal domain-containing protein n=1 Tax=Oricola sp. TaxID=1979950 RepID=UPI0025F2033F|nr:twin-arginine translocation signal domain-containing protein [Oricola sp.]MCI5077440.1 twin-arginine translocation signal domain-containing protein [Oricola sp.]
MNDKNNPTRRRVLKLGGAAGAAAVTIALPETWTKPVVQLIAVPAHADASPVGPTTPNPTTSEDPTTTTSTTEEPTTTEESTTTTEPP